MPDNNYPPELEAALLAVFERHVGKKNKILGNSLLWKLTTMQVHTNERSMRECIKQLRRKGHLICALPGVEGGYYYAETLQEYQEFDKAEFTAKIMDMLATRRAMKLAARRVFSEVHQMELL